MGSETGVRIGLAEGCVARNPALLLFTPRGASKPTKETMTTFEVQACFLALAQRERLIAKLTIICRHASGGNSGADLGRNDLDLCQCQAEVYRGVIDRPKSEQSLRRVALSEGLLQEIVAWRSLAVSTDPSAWVFPSERMTPLAKENVWRRLAQATTGRFGMGQFPS